MAGSFLTMRSFLRERPHERVLWWTSVHGDAYGDVHERPSCTPSKLVDGCCQRSLMCERHERGDERFFFLTQFHGTAMGILRESTKRLVRRTLIIIDNRLSYNISTTVYRITKHLNRAR